MTAYPVCGTAVRRLEHLKFKIQNLASPSSPPNGGSVQIPDSVVDNPRQYSLLCFSGIGIREFFVILLIK